MQCNYCHEPDITDDHLFRYHAHMVDEIRNRQLRDKLIERAAELLRPESRIDIHWEEKYEEWLREVEGK